MPLNTARELSGIQLDRVIELICLMAVLAVQNLEGAQVFDKNSDQAVEYAALEGSLQMMSQVLNVRFSSVVFLQILDLTSGAGRLGLHPHVRPAPDLRSAPSSLTSSAS